MNPVVIIPAHNEAPRILDVLSPTLEAVGRGHVIVVDDGSTDATAAVARAAGARVLSLSPNRGKGQAMRAGVGSAPPGTDAVLFLDADLIGLTADHVRELLAPLAAGSADMVCGLRDYGPAINALQAAMPPITGERAVRMSILRSVSPDDWNGFKVEAGINEACRRAGGRVTLCVMNGVTIVPKWQKDGDARRGFVDAARMGHEVLSAMARARDRVVYPPPAPFIVDAIVPAHNEAGRVGRVVRTLRSASVFRSIVVVDDGSTDDTAAEARVAGAGVLGMGTNVGKGQAMRAAAMAPPQRGQRVAPWVAFFDADLVDLTVEHVAAMRAEAATGSYGMVSGCWVQRPGALQELYVLYGIDLSGQRFVHRSVLDRLPEPLWGGYGVEVGLEEACSRMGYARRRIMLEGLRNTSQLEKLGATDGTLRVARIMTDALRAAGGAARGTW